LAPPFLEEGVPLEGVPLEGVPLEGVPLERVAAPVAGVSVSAFVSALAPPFLEGVAAAVVVGVGCPAIEWRRKGG